MQTMLQYNLRLIWIFLELTGLRFFAESYLSAGETRRNKRLLLLPAGGILVVCAFLQVPELWMLFLSGFLGTAWTLFVFQGKPGRRIWIGGLAWVLGLGIDTVVCFVFSLLLGVRFVDPVWQTLLHYVVMTASKLIWLFTAYLIRRFHMPDAAGFVFSKGLFLTMLFPCLGLILIVAVFHGFSSGAAIADGGLLACLVLAIANVAVLFLVHTPEKTGKAEAELTLLNKQMELQTQSILSLEKSYRAQRRAAHEFRHHLQTLRDLLDREELAAAKEYVEKLQQTSTTRVLCVNSRHPIVDAILNQKYQTASEESIDVQMQVNDLSGLTVDPEALVVVLTNLLDNAIEACERLQEGRSIRCSVLLEDSLFLSVSNTAPPVQIEDNTIKSTKMPRQDHGYGLPAICSVLDKLNAEYAFDYENGWFRFVAEIPLT